LSGSQTGLRNYQRRILYKVDGTPASHTFTSSSLAVGGGYATADPPYTITATGDIGASGDIITDGEFKGKWKNITTHAFYVTVNTAVQVPMGGTLAESSFGDSYTHRTVAPYDGRLVRVMAACQNSDAGLMTIGLTTGSGTNNALGMNFNTGELQSIPSTIDDQTYKFDFTGSGATFTAGEWIGISFQQANAVANGTYMTVVWEYDNKDGDTWSNP
jgi:hypothetical protein